MLAVREFQHQNDTKAASRGGRQSRSLRLLAHFTAQSGRASSGITAERDKFCCWLHKCEAEAKQAGYMLALPAKVTPGGAKRPACVKENKQKKKQEKVCVSRLLKIKRESCVVLVVSAVGRRGGGGLGGRDARQETLAD